MSDNRITGSEEKERKGGGGTHWTETKVLNILTSSITSHGQVHKPWPMSNDNFPLPRKPDGPQMPSPPWLHHGLPLERLGRPLPHHPPLLRFWLISILSYVSNSWEQFAMNKDLAINHLVFWKWPHQWQFSQEHGVFKHKVTVTSTWVKIKFVQQSSHHISFW